MDVERLMKDAQYADQSGHPHRALGLVNKAFSLLAELHPQISGERAGTAMLLQSQSSGPELNQIEHQGFLLRSKCYLALGRLEVSQPHHVERSENNYFYNLGGSH